MNRRKEIVVVRRGGSKLLGMCKALLMSDGWSELLSSEVSEVFFDHLCGNQKAGSHQLSRSMIVSNAFVDGEVWQEINSLRSLTDPCVVQR